jgi:hypothetical protein
MICSLILRLGILVVRFDVFVRVFEHLFQSGDLLLRVANAIQRIVEGADTGAQACSNSHE